MVRSAEIRIAQAVTGLILSGCLSLPVAAAEISRQEILDRFEQLEGQIAEMEDQLAERDERIRVLETELGVAEPEDSPPVAQTPAVAAESGLVVILHSDIDVPFASEGAEPVYLTQMKDLLRRHPRTTIIWAHTGLGRVVHPPQSDKVQSAMERSPDRFLFGTDEVAPKNQQSYL